MTSRLLIETSFSLEQRAINQHTLELPPQPDFLLIHFLESPSANPTAGASLLANPHQSVKLRLNRQRHELLLVRIAPELLIETATRLRLYRTGAHLLFRQPLTPLTDDARLQNVLVAITGEMKSGATGWREVIRAQINQPAAHTYQCATLGRNRVIACRRG